MKKYLMIFVLLFSLSTFANAHPQEDPVALLKYVADHMISGLKANKANLKTKPEVVYKLAYQYVVPNADLSVISQHVLSPPVWNRASVTERKAFEKEFTKTIIRTYASALSAYEDQQVKVFPIRENYRAAKTVVVNSQIESSENPAVQVSYRLIHVGNAWKLYDLSVEGVSLLESFRSQFADILATGNLKTLIEKMKSHNQRVAS